MVLGLAHLGVLQAVGFAEERGHADHLRLHSWLETRLSCLELRDKACSSHQSFLPSAWDQRWLKGLIPLATYRAIIILHHSPRQLIRGGVEPIFGLLRAQEIH